MQKLKIMKGVLVVFVAANLLMVGVACWSIYFNDADGFSLDDQQDLVLIKEHNKQVLDEAGESYVLDGKASVNQSVNKQSEDDFNCVALGGVEERKTASKLMAVFLSSGIKSVISSYKIENKNDYDYWVVMPIEKGEKFSVDMLKKIQSERVDAEIVKDGDHEGSISLGVFPSRAAAYSIYEMMLERGYERTFLEKVVSYRKSYSVMVKKEDFIRIVKDSIMNVLTEQFGKLEIKEVLCDPSLAS